MARRRLLTLLASTALLIGALAGPAAALDLGEVANTTPVEVSEVAAVVEEVVEDVAPAAVAEAVEAPAPVVEAVTPERETAPQAEPAPTTNAPAAPAHAVRDDTVVAAGGVTSAPPIDLLVSLGGSERTPQPSAGARLDTPTMTTVESTTDEVPAPQVAPSPAVAPAPAVASAPTALTQAMDGLPEESAPALALIALAALVAAGAGTLKTARIEATA